VAGERLAAMTLSQTEQTLCAGGAGIRRFPSENMGLVLIASSLEDREAEERLHVEVETSDLGERLFENGGAARLEGHGKGQSGMRVPRLLQERVDADVIFRENSSHFGDDTRTVADDEAEIMRDGEFTADGFGNLQ